MRRWRIGASAMAAAIVLAPVAPLSARADAAKVSERAAPAEIDRNKLLDAVIETIARRFVDEGKLKQIDWRARAEAVRPQIMSASTTTDVVARINQLLAELDTSHTALYAPDDYQYAILLDIVGGGESGARLLAEKYWGVGPYYPGVGLFTRAIDGKHFVDGVMEGSPADKAGVKIGDEILSVDDAPYSPVAAFRGKIGRTVALEIRRARDAAPERLDIAVIPIRPNAAFAAATRASSRIIERAGRRIGYVHVWSVTDARSFREALARLGDGGSPGARNNRATPPDALIIDARGRVGGSTNVAEEMLQAIDDAQKPYWGRWRAIDRGGEGRRGWTRPGDQPSWARSYRGRSALLIDDHTRSAGEILALGFQRSDFGPVIGTRTAGAVTAGAVEVMPGDLILYVAVSALEFEGGRRLEGVGVTPDQIVERRVEYAAGADPVLDAAIDRLLQSTPH